MNSSVVDQELVKLSSYGPRSFAVAGPTIWINNLPEYLRDPELSINILGVSLKKHSRLHSRPIGLLKTTLYRIRNCVPVHSIKFQGDQ